MDKLRFLIGNALPLVEYFWGGGGFWDGLSSFGRQRCVTHFKDKSKLGNRKFHYQLKNSRLILKNVKTRLIQITLQ
jgi:hypothetical protein